MQSAKAKVFSLLELFASSKKTELDRMSVSLLRSMVPVRIRILSFNIEKFSTSRPPYGERLSFMQPGIGYQFNLVVIT